MAKPRKGIERTAEVLVGSGFAFCVLPFDLFFSDRKNVFILDVEAGLFTIFQFRFLSFQFPFSTFFLRGAIYREA